MLPAITWLKERYSNIFSEKLHRLTFTTISQPICLGFTGQDCIQTHVVISGDSCYAIALSANISGTVLADNNPNINTACSNIYPGEVILLLLVLFRSFLTYFHTTGIVHG